MKHHYYNIGSVTGLHCKIMTDMIDLAVLNTLACNYKLVTRITYELLMASGWVE